MLLFAPIMLLVGVGKAIETKDWKALVVGVFTAAVFLAGGLFGLRVAAGYRSDTWIKKPPPTSDLE